MRQIVREHGSDASKDQDNIAGSSPGQDVELAEMPSSSPTLPGKISIPGTDFSWLDKKAIREVKAKQLQLRSSWRPGEDASQLMRMVRCNLEFGWSVLLHSVMLVLDEASIFVPC